MPRYIKLRMVLAAYCLGIYLVSWLPVLSTNLALVMMSLWASLLGIAVLTRRRGLLLFLAGLITGMIWHWCWGTLRLHQTLPAVLEGVDLQLQGTVVGLPLTTEFGQSFDFLVDPDQPELSQRTLRLNNFGEEFVVAGERWQLELRLKRPHGFANPGGNDREAYLLRQGYAATGYLRQGSGNRKLGNAEFRFPNLVSQLRSRLLGHLQERLRTMQHSELMLALVLGERGQLKREHWRLFTATGTNHLFVISGLHIGLVSLFCFRLATWLLKLIPPMLLCCPAQWGAALISMMVALAYSLLAGWGLPTQRACIMVLLFLSAFLSRRRCGLGLRFMLALVLVLSLDPLATTSMGFWLSFSAVGVLLFFVLPGHFQVPVEPVTAPRSHVWYSYLSPQWYVFLGLFVPLGMMLGQVSLLAPLANLLTIPILAMLLLPLLLLASLFSMVQQELSHGLFVSADVVLHYILFLLESLSRLAGAPGTLSVHSVPAASLLFIVPGIILLLTARAQPYRHLALPLLLPLFFSGEAPVADGLTVHVLDVGQGLAVLLQTQNHSLLYDTGPGNGADWNAGEAIVIPALRKLGVGRLDRIIVSHGDSDHAGGLQSILASFPDTPVFSGSRLEEPLVQPCLSGQKWQWDQVEFSFLHPGSPWRGVAGEQHPNNQSCVLRVSAGEFSVLLPGDIESDVERRLASSSARSLASTVLIAPHHGSNTSSSYPFLKRVDADHVIFASGYGNGFGHPAPRVVQRHSVMGAKSHATAARGMITIISPETGTSPQIRYYRQNHRRYWSWSGNPSNCRYC